MTRKEIKVRLHPSKHKRLKVLAAKQGKSLNFIMEVAIADFLAKYENLDYDKIIEGRERD